jgi:MFS superfamily sulfate permease-like transporter
MTDLPAKIYDETDIARARRRGKFVGWVQGAGAVFLVGIVLNLLGWIPTVAVAGLVGYVAYKLLFRGSKDDAELPEDEEI